MGFKDTPEWKKGQAAEKIVMAYYQQRGTYVIPTSMIDNGGAPMAEGWLKKYVLPDNMIIGAQGARWVEVKGKRWATKNQKVNRWEHGVDLPNWQAYLELQKRSGIPGILAIVQRDSWELLEGSFDCIAKRARIDDVPRSHAANGMAYFDVRDFERHGVASIAATLGIEWDDDDNGTAVRRPWEEPPKPPAPEQGSLF